MNDFNYQVGGSLHNQDISYVEREADTQFSEALQKGEFCYILNSRQMGKSSLLVRTKYRLEKLGFYCAAIDLTGIGSDNVNPEQWYRGIISQLYLGFNLIGKVDLKKWWEEQQNITLIQKLNKFIVDIILVEFCEQKLVIFVDEIDSIFSLPFSTDDFFAFIRFCYNQRAITPEYQRINFAIFGVTTPSSLILDKHRTPFNIGQAISLNGFSFEESLSLAQGLNLNYDVGKLILKDILQWTGGQPFLTQKLCYLIANYFLDRDRQKIQYCNDLVKNIVQQKIINNWKSQDDPEHLRTIVNRILNSKSKAIRLLGIYQQILFQNKVIRDDSLEQLELLLSGLVVEKQGYLKVKNLIYQTIFNLEWVERQLNLLRPYATQLRQWLNSQKQDNSQLLQNIFLEQALIWAQDKQLADTDYQFLAASQELAKQQAEYQLSLEQITRKKVEVALEAATEASKTLAEVQQTIRRRNKNFRLSKIWLVGIIFLISSFTIALRFTGWVQSPELIVFDYFMQIRPVNRIEERVVIIGINETDLQNLGEYPITDQILARTINRLQSYEPRVIGLDIYRDLPVEPGTEQLKAIFANNSNLLGIEKILNGKVNPPRILAELNQVGFNDMVLDRDGKVRRALLSYETKERKIKYSFALRLALNYLAKSNIQPKQLSNHQIKLGQAIFKHLNPNDGGYVRAKTGGYQILLNYYGRQQNFTVYSLTELLAEKIDQSAIADRIVLIGVTAPSINDSLATPYSAQQLMPGVVIHSNIISQILQAALSGKGVIEVLPEVGEWLWILGWTCVGAILACSFKSKINLLIAITSTLFVLVLVSYQLFIWGWWFPIIPAIVSLITVVLVTILVTQQQKSKIQLKQKVALLLAISEDKPAAGQIAIEYLKQGESPENWAIIQKIINS